MGAAGLSGELSGVDATLCCIERRPRYPRPQDPAIALQLPPALSTTSTASVTPPQATDASAPMSAAARHLHQQLREMQGRYDVLSKCIAALDKDLGRTLDSETKLVLEERRH